MALKAYEPFMFILTSLSFCVYLVVLRMLVRFRDKHPFSSSFYRICVSLAISDLFSILHNHLAFKFRLWGVLGLDELYLSTAAGTQWCSVWVSLAFYNGFVQALGVLLISFNRFTSLVTPLRHVLIWGKLQHLIALSWLVPAVLMAPWWAAGPEVVTVYRNNATHDVRFLLNPPYKKAYYLVTFVVFLIVAVLVMPMYSIGFHSYTKQKNKVTPFKAGDGNKLEAKLALIGFLMSCVLLNYVLFSTLSLVLLRTTHKGQLNPLMPLYLISVDLLSTCNPWILLACSRQVRTHFVMSLLCRQDVQVDVLHK